MSEKYNITFQIHTSQELEFRLEEGVSVLFGLNGYSQVFTGVKDYELGKAGLLVINPMDVYQITCPDGAAILCMHIGKEVMDISGWQNSKHCICFAENDDMQDVNLNSVRTHLAECFHEYLQSRTVSTDLQSPLMQMLKVLQNDFSLTYRAHGQRETAMRRMKHILDSIHTRWNEDISLAEIASEEYMSVSYLSRFFQKTMGITFSQYIKRLRLIHAVRELIQTDESVTRIAYNCGFRTPSAFIEVFKEQYSLTPGQFRESKREQQRLQAAFSRISLNSDVSSLLDYLPEQPVEIHTENKYISIDCASTKGKNIKWRRILNIGYARDGLSAQVQEQIRQAQREIGFEYIRFHGILDNDMHVYWEDEQGQPVFHFAYVNMLFVLFCHLVSSLMWS